MTGTYHEQVVPQNSGVTYAAYSGETVTTDGFEGTLPDDMAGWNMNIIGKENVYESSDDK